MSLLQFAQQLVFKSLQIHALLFVVAYLFGHLLRLHVNILSSILALLLNEFILLRQTILLLLANLLLTELSLIVILLAHAIQVVFHLFFLPSHFLNSCHLLISEVSVAEQDLLLLFFLSLASVFSILFFFLLPSLLLAPSKQNFVVVLILQILQLPCLFPCLINLLDGPEFFVLKHPYAIAQLLNVSLEL